jgi:hypothetical protein
MSSSASLYSLTCHGCKETLHYGRDSQKTTGRYFKNCQRCRDKNTSAKRRKRGLPPVGSSPKIMDGVTVALQPLDAISSSSPGKHTRGMCFSQRFSTHQIRERDGGSSSANMNVSRYVLTRPPDRPLVNPTCSVCGEVVPPAEYPLLQRCSHEPRVCEDCFANWLTSQVENTSWDRIVCPSEGYSVSIDHEDMKTLASKETYTRYALLLVQTVAVLITTVRYDGLSTRNYVGNILNFRYCLRPGCNSGQSHDSGVEGNIFRCSGCNFLMCTTHNEAFHAGETCEAYDKRKSCKRKVEDDASIEKIRSTTKQCPGDSCGVCIEKNDGCDHMTCKWCNMIPWCGR